MQNAGKKCDIGKAAGGKEYYCRDASKKPVKFALAALLLSVLFLTAACTGKTGSGTGDGKAGGDTLQPPTAKVTEVPQQEPSVTNGAEHSADDNDPAAGEGISENPAEMTGKDSNDRTDTAEKDNNNPTDTAGGDAKEDADGVNGVADQALTDEPEPEKVYLYISEILPTNSKYNKHNGDYFDAIELYNASENPIMLSDFCLSDSKKKLTDYPLPEVELPAGGYAVFYCTGSYYASDEYDLRFRLSYFGEKVYLADREGNIIDMLQYTKLPQNVSIGRDGDEVRIYDEPSLGEPNTGGFERVSTVPAVDLEPGFYEGVQTVKFTTPGTIRYTLDGSRPNSSSKVWDGSPIVLSATCALRAYAEEENCLASFVSTYDYLFNTPEYELDVVMLSIKESDFDTMNANYNSHSKYAANISLFSEGKQEFTADCAVSVFGATSRAYAKKSYQIKFSAAYGPSKLRYKVFDDLDIDEFDSLVLRSGSQDNDGPLMRDEFVSGVSMSTGLIDDILIQAYRPVNLYINDRYWGIYYIREHIDEDMVASHYGCEPEEVTIIKQMSEIKCGRDYKEWLDLWKFISSNKLKDADAYGYVKSVADLQSVADYYIIQLWCGNVDMDNVYVCKAGDGKWFYILYDLDLTLYREAAGTTQKQLGTFNTGFYTFNALINRLLDNDEFREMFCRRMADIVTTVYSDENVLSYANRLAGLIYHDMAYNCERWQSVEDPSKDIKYRSYNSWKRSVEALRKQITGRGKLIAEDFIKEKNISSELVEKYFSDLK